MPPRLGVKTLVRLCFGGFLGTCIFQHMLSYQTYSYCDHVVVNTLAVVLASWWLKIEQIEQGPSAVIISIIEAVFIFGMLEGWKMEGCDDHYTRFEYLLPRVSNLVIFITIWLDSILIIFLVLFLATFVPYQLVKEALDGRRDQSRVANRYGLSEEQKNELYKRVYKNDSQKEDVECSVCLLRMEQGEETINLPQCDHKFHMDCLKGWIDFHSTCPYCREVITI